MRRQRTTSDWASLIEEYRRSGRTQKDFCGERGISVSSLQSHLRAGFVEVSQAPLRTSSTELEISFRDGTVVRIRG